MIRVLWFNGFLFLEIINLSISVGVKFYKGFVVLIKGGMNYLWCDLSWLYIVYY